MLQRHWRLTRDPFRPGGSPFVATPTHAEALARLDHLIQSAERMVTLLAGPGLGKTTVAHAALAQARSPRRRIAHCQGPPDSATLFAELARGLGVFGPPAASRAPRLARPGRWRAALPRPETGRGPARR